MKNFKTLDDLWDSDAVLIAPVTPDGKVAGNEARYFQAAALRSALSADLQPLGEALAGALQAGDLPAMQAALRKISENMPELAGDAGNLADVLTEEFTNAFTQDETDES